MLIIIANTTIVVYINRILTQPSNYKSWGCTNSDGFSMDFRLLKI